MPETIPTNLADEVRNIGDKLHTAVDQLAEDQADFNDISEQLSVIDGKLDTVNSKLPIPQYQIKTVNPSNVQQTVIPDNNYAALSGVVVNPISAAMPENLEDYILRKNTMPEFTLSLSGDVPNYACYGQKKLVAVYGEPTSIGSYAFYYCTNLQKIDCSQATNISNNAFHGCTSLQNIDCRNATTIGITAFNDCDSLKTADCRNLLNLLAIFVNCKNISAVDLRNITSIETGNGNFRQNGVSNLALLDITNSHAATLGNSGSIPNNANLTILVADATDKAHYQSATNWSTHASKIKTVAEYEQEIGMTYDEYYLQVFGHTRN